MTEIAVYDSAMTLTQIVYTVDFVKVVADVPHMVEPNRMVARPGGTVSHRVSDTYSVKVKVVNIIVLDDYRISLQDLYPLSRPEQKSSVCDNGLVNHRDSRRNMAPPIIKRAVHRPRPVGMSIVDVRRGCIAPPISE